MDEDIRIFCPLDYRKLPVKDGSVDLVATDPLYHKDKVHEWEAVAEWSARKLKPGGKFFAYTGTQYLPAVLKGLTKHLVYRDLFFVVFPRPAKSFVGKSYARMKYTKAAIFATKGELTGKQFFVKDFYRAKSFKRLHEWQAPLDASMYYMSHLSKQGDLIVDPLGGSWDFAVAARKLHRRCISCDIDPACLPLWEERLKAGD